MASFENGFITFDEERNIYYAGQVLYGRIDFTLSQPLDFRAITVEFHGEANVHWEDSEIEEYNGVRTNKIVKYRAREEYLNLVHCVCGGVGVSQLAMGSHSIPFRCQIPPTAPSTFTGAESGSDEIGEVRYWVKACLQYTDGRPNAELEKPFEVVVPLDLNVDAEMGQPMFVEFEEVVGGCLCGSGALNVQVRLPATGLCPGQVVPVDVTAHNQSGVEVSKVLFQLIQRERYHSHSPPSEQTLPETVIATARQGPIMANTKRSFTYNFRVPDMIAPVLDKCSIIDVGFFFKVILQISGCNDDQDDETEIRLGLVPLYALTQGDYKHPLQSDLPKAPIPNPNTPPEYILSEIYPSKTLEVLSFPTIQPVQVSNVSSMPGGNAPYPGFNTPYPGVGYPYTGNSYSAPNPPYPTQDTPYPSNPPAYAPVQIGFTAPGLTSPYPPGPEPIAASSPYNPSAPSAP